MKLDILGISETRWPSYGQFPTKNGMMYFFGNEDNHYRHVVAIIVSKDVISSVTNFTPVSDWIMLLQLQTNTVKLNIIQIYIPTADKCEEEIELFYETNRKDTWITKAKRHYDNARNFKKIGKRCDKYIGEYGFGTRNERGNRLLQFCQEKEMISNTFYKLLDGKLYTWKSSQYYDQRIIRNQIDYILINERYRNCIKSELRLDGSSDHNPLIAQVYIKRITKKRESQINVGHLKKQDVRQDLQTKINELENI